VLTTRAGQGKGYKQRVFLVYDGLHYDAFGLNPMPDGPEDFDTTVFSPNDDYVCRNALTIVRGLKEKHLYTDTGSFRLLCGDCQAGTVPSSLIAPYGSACGCSLLTLNCGSVLVGEKGATEHAMATGHTNFTEAK
jgi:ubiquitin thioesterase OTU1